MTFLNTSSHPFKAFCRKEFLYDLQQHAGEYVPAMVFGVSAVMGRAIGFHVMTDFGAVFWRLPIHALVWKLVSDLLDLDNLELWDSLGYSVSVTKFDFLDGLRCAFFSRDHRWLYGQYVYTIDFCDADAPGMFSETPDEHKCAHLIRLDNGYFALQPNNRMRRFEPAWVTKEFPKQPDFKVNTHTWTVEQTGRWKTDDSKDFFYKITGTTNSAIETQRSPVAEDINTNTGSIKIKQATALQAYNDVGNKPVSRVCGYYACRSCGTCNAVHSNDDGGCSNAVDLNA